jgi:ATP-binding cassette subfamily B protein
MTKTKRKWLAPEVVQTSAMDCGPASLKCLLEGHGIGVSYGRLREACQTSVDGTSIDTLEEVACQLGMDAEQIMVPMDHLFRTEVANTPSILITSTPAGLTHFVVIWKQIGQMVQVMDPATGRQWLPAASLLQRTYCHTMPVPSELWEDWVDSEEFLLPLKGRMQEAGIPRITQTDHLGQASASEVPGAAFAALDAATRLVDSLVKAKTLRKGNEATALLEQLTQQGYQAFLQAEPTEENESIGPIPRRYWTVTPEEPDEDDDPQVLLKGAVLLRINGLLPQEEREAAQQDLSPELSAALQAPPDNALGELFTMMKEDGYLAPSIIVLAMAISACGVLFQAVLFRGFFEVGNVVSSSLQRAHVLGGVIAFSIGLLLLGWAVQTALLRAGRHLEAKLRMAFLAKLPKLNDRYFQSRLRSDMADRSHSVDDLRALPGVGANWLRTLFELLLTTAGVIWLAPSHAWLVLLLAVVVVALPLLLQPLQIEKDLRARTHAGALSRFYFDALLGHTAIKAHGAERAVRREHEGLLVEWYHASIALLKLMVRLDAVQALIGLSLVGWLLFTHIQSGGEPASLLLLVYWALNLPTIGQSLAQLTRTLPALRNIALRLFEPLGAPETHDTEPTPDGRPQSSVSIELQDVTVEAGGHTILEEIELSIEPGEHIAVVGASGAGKSSLVGLLLGWHRAEQGTVFVDGQPLTQGRLQQLRQHTAWVDPDITLWNQSLLANLCYGNPALTPNELSPTLDAADLRDVLERMPHGFQTEVGEGGALLSGGQGQRVRLGRALLRNQPRLVCLDEPFRGLDRNRRRALLAQARQRWKDTTLLCVTHDVGDTLSFPRVLVVHAGRIVEDANPTALAEQQDSVYARLLAAETLVTEGMWASDEWKRLWVMDAQLHTQPTSEVSS